MKPMQITICDLNVDVLSELSASELRLAGGFDPRKATATIIPGHSPERVSPDGSVLTPAYWVRAK